MASRRSKPPAKLVANKRPRRKPTLPVTIEADDVKITKKYGHIYLRFSQAGKATGTSITDERGLISIIMALQGIAEQSGDIELIGQAINMSRTPFEMRSATPEQGEHTEQVLKEAGYDAAAIEDFRKRKVI